MSEYYSRGTNLRYESITAEQERELFIKARAGDELAKEQILRNHLLSAAIIGRRYGKGLPDDEVVSAANFGLVKALERALKTFDPTRDARFISFMPKFVRGELARLWKSRNPVRQYDFDEGGSSAVPLTESTGVDEMLEDHPVEQNDHDAFMVKLLVESQGQLPPREAEIIALRFGEDKWTLEELAGLLDLTRQRIEQLEKTALRRLRDLMGSKMRAAGVTR